MSAPPVVDLGPVTGCQQCARPIRWVRSPRMRRFAVDAAPHERGGLILYRDDGHLIAAYEGQVPLELDPATPDRYHRHDCRFPEG